MTEHPLLLHLETSSKNCSVAITHGDKLLCLCEEASEGYHHAEKLHLFIQYALEGAEVDLKQIQGICVGAGPGSYTGLRIGAAAAKGFAYALELPLLSVDATQALANEYLGKEGFHRIYSVLDARRMEVYIAEYNAITGEALQSPRPLVLEEEGAAFFSDTDFSESLFVGDACEKVALFLQKQDLMKSIHALPSAQYFLPTALEKFHRKDFEDTAYFDPKYLKNNYVK